MAQRAIRLPKELVEEVDRTAKDRGYRSSSAFMRDAIRNELQRSHPETGPEERLAASFDRLSQELRRVGTGQQALFAFTDALVKAFLVCVPEPPGGEALDASKARARTRYDKFVRNAALAMTGDSRAAFRELMNRES